VPTQDIAADREECATYRFGELTLDAGNFELRRGAEVVAIQRKVFDVLHLLITRAGQVVSRDELLDTLWPGEYVTESALAFSVSHVRRALGQPRGQKTPLETIRGRGFRFVDPVTRELPTVGATTASTAATDSDFVGRGTILESAAPALAEAVAGRGALWLLRGEAGIGKTRCADELAAAARAAGFGVWWGRCAEDESAPPLWPFIQVLRSCAADSGIAAELAGRAQALAAQLAAPDATADDPADDGRATTFSVLDSVTQLLDEATRHRPALVVLDDLHQADEMSLRLLRLWAPELPSRHMLVVGTLRFHEAASETCQALIERCQRRAVTHDLTAFGTAEIGACADRVLQSRPPAAIVEALRARTAGNPLFISELLELVRTRHGDDWSAVDVAALELPPAVHSAFESRLAALPAGLRELLELASVLGERFELSVLESVRGSAAQADATDLLDLLDAAEAQQLIRPDGGVTRYAFHHAVLRELLYEGLSSSRRVELHACVAQVLESVAVGGERLREVAFHLHRALPGGGGEKLVGVAEQAAGAARRVGAHADAARLLGWAMEAESLRHPPDAHAQCRLLLSQGVAYVAAGRHPEARRTLREVADLADEHGFGELLLSAARALRPTKLWALMTDELALRCLEAARQHLSPSDLPRRIGVLCALATIPPHSRSESRRRALIDEAAELAARLDSAAGDLQILQARMASMTGPDDTDGLLRACADVLEVPGDARSDRSTLDALIMRYHAYMQLGEFDQGRAALSEFGQLAERVGDVGARWHHDRYRAQMRVVRGELDAAEEEGRALVERARRAELQLAEWFALMHAAWLLHEREGAAAVITSELFSHLREIARATPFQNAHVQALWAEAGETGALREAFEKTAQRAFGESVRDLDYLPNLCLYARAAVALSDRPRMALIAERLAPYEGRMAIGSFGACGGPIAHYVGMLHSATGELDSAERYLRASIEQARRLSLPGATMDSELELGVVLAQLGRDDEARALLVAVDERASGLRLLRYQRRASAALSAL